MTNIIKEINPLREAIRETGDNYLITLADKLDDQQLDRLKELINKNGLSQQIRRKLDRYSKNSIRK